MKLQLVEYKSFDQLNMCDMYRYTLELDGRLMLRFETMNLRVPMDDVIKKLMASLRLLTDFNLEHYNKFNFDKMPGISKKVLFEQEVPDTYLKNLCIESRIKQIQEDFK